MRKKIRHKKLKKRSPIFAFLKYIIGLSILCAFVYLIASFKTSVICANTITCANDLSLKIENGQTGTFHNQKIAVPDIYLSLNDLKPNVLGEATSSGEKHIYVDLTHQLLSAYQGETLVMQTPISSGKWYATPTGDFRIWVKLRSTRMSGGVGDDAYDLPNVPYVMFFSNSDVPKSAGFSLHGAYWHNNFGHPMSHGCVNMRSVDAEKLYNWADPPTDGYTTYSDQKNEGTLVTIFGEAP